MDAFARVPEHLLNLPVQLVPVGQDQHAGMGQVLQDPTRQQHHHDALPAPLGVPQDPALLRHQPRLRRLHPEILLRAR